MCANPKWDHLRSCVYIVCLLFVAALCSYVLTCLSFQFDIGLKPEGSVELISNDLSRLSERFHALLLSLQLVIWLTSRFIPRGYRWSILQPEAPYQRAAIIKELDGLFLANQTWIVLRRADLPKKHSSLMRCHIMALAINTRLPDRWVY